MTDLSVDDWNGVNTLVSHYLRPEPTDTVVIIHSSASVNEAIWIKVALESRGVDTTLLWMIPLRDPEFETRLSHTLSTIDARGHLVVVVVETETISHDAELRSCLRSYKPDKVKVFRVITAGGLIFSRGLAVIPDELSSRNTTLLERLVPEKTVRVVAPGGTDLTIEFDPRYRWVSNRGVWTPGTSVILPAGEIATYAKTVDGVFVADFGINVNIHTDQDARLTGSPVTVIVENGQAVSFKCDDSLVLRFVDECLATDCARRVGEVGFGTNFGVREPVAKNSHINERHPGLHLGFGESNQSPDLVGYDCNIHLDLVSSGGVITLGDATEIDLMDVPPSLNPHPTHTRSEDAFSSDGSGGLVDSDDCCSYVGDLMPKPTLTETAWP